MSLFENLKDGKDLDYSSDDQLEEQYQKMFKKIARDFVHIDDFKDILRTMLVDIINDVNNLEQNSFAYLKAKEYEENLNKKLSERKKYLDVDDIFSKK